MTDNARVVREALRAAAGYAWYSNAIIAGDALKSLAEHAPDAVLLKLKGLMK